MLRQMWFSRCEVSGILPHMNKLGYLVIGMLFVLACQTPSKGDIHYKEGVWATFFAVPSNGLEFACDNGPLNWNGGKGDCFFAGSLSTNSDSNSQALSFFACPPDGNCTYGDSRDQHIKASLYEDSQGNLIVKLPPGGTIKVVH